MRKGTINPEDPTRREGPNAFLVPKKDGGKRSRPVINLKRLSRHSKQTFLVLW